MTDISELVRARFNLQRLANHQLRQGDICAAYQTQGEVFDVEALLAKARKERMTQSALLLDRMINREAAQAMEVVAIRETNHQ